MTDDITSFSKADQDLESLCDDVYDRGEPAVITRKDGRHMVLMSLEHYQHLTGENKPSTEHLDNLYIELERELDA